MPKSPQFVLKIKISVQYSLKSTTILGIGGGGGEVAEINFFRKKFFVSGRAQSGKSGKFRSAPPIFSFPYAYGKTTRSWQTDRCNLFRYVKGF